MIEIRDLAFSYGRKKPVFSNLSLTMEDNNVYGLLGRNGAGKSTLLYLISGLLRPEGGTVTCMGHNPFRREPETLQDLFLVPEEFALPEVKMEDYVRRNAPFYPHFSDETLKSCLRGFDMDTDMHLGQLSMGEKKKAYMCFALATNTKLLLMDEPSNGMDIPSKSQFRRAVAAGMSEGKTIVISTHQVKDVDALLDRVMIIDHSRMLLDESVSHITERLCFEERSMSEPTDDALYVQTSIGGNSVVLRKSDGEETPLNLELLFNATLADVAPINQALRNDEQ